MFWIQPLYYLFLPTVSHIIIATRCSTPASYGQICKISLEETLDLKLFTNGFSYYVNRKQHRGYTLLRNFKTLETEALQPFLMAQGAKLIELAKAALWWHDQQASLFLLSLNKLLECVMQWVRYGKNESALLQQKTVFPMDFKSRFYSGSY